MGDNCKPSNTSDLQAATTTTTAPTTKKQLEAVLDTTTTRQRPLPGQPRFTTCMDECFPGIFIGGMDAAKKKGYLEKMGISHVVNTAEGTNFTMVDTNQDYYQAEGIKYMGFRLLDISSSKISQYFEQTAQFIDDALASGGNVLVNCFMGMSRSATIVCAFLMLRRKMAAAEALAILKSNRPIQPNHGFLEQLADLDNKLRKEQNS